MKLRYRTVRILEENPFSRPYLAPFGQRDRRNAKGYACFCKEDDGTDLRIDIPEPINSRITFKRPGSFLLIGVIHAPHRAPDNLFKGDNVRDTAYTAG